MGENREERMYFGRGSGDCEPISVNYCYNSARTRSSAHCRRQFTAPRPLSYPLVKSDRTKADLFTQGSIESGFSDLSVDTHRALDGEDKETKRKGDGGNKRNTINGITPDRLSAAQNRINSSKGAISHRSKSASATLDLKTRGDNGRLRSFNILPRPFVDSVDLSDRDGDITISFPATQHNKGRGIVPSAKTKTDISSVNRVQHSTDAWLISNSEHNIKQTKGLTSEHLHTSAIISERETDVKRNFVESDASPPRSHFNESVDITIPKSATLVPLAAGELQSPLNATPNISRGTKNDSDVQPDQKTSDIQQRNDCRCSRCFVTGAHSYNLVETARTPELRELSSGMGNAVQRRACEGKTYSDETSERDQYTRNSEKPLEPSTTQRQNQPSGEKSKTTGGKFDEGGGKFTRAIPELIVSDSSMDQEPEVDADQAHRYSAGYTVIRPAQERASSTFPHKDDTIELDSNKKFPLQLHTSTDSAYSTDSKSTMPDGSSEQMAHVDEVAVEGAVGKEYTSIHKGLLKPSTRAPNARSISSSSSSSSSSSPCHPSSWNDNSPAAPMSTATESTLRVMSDIGSQRKLSSSSGSSFRSSLSFEESEDDMLSSDGESILREHMAKKGRRQSKAQSSWTKIRRMVIWSPFMQSFKKKYPWVQLAGHAGNFQPGEEGCILKKFCAREAECLSRLSVDNELRTFAPEYHGLVEKDGEKYTRMQDLLLAFDCPSVMDCKMGIRTYLEDELVKAKIRPRLRHDMYKKMTEIAPDEPTPEEHEERAVTKPRYMQWREHVSSSSNLGFRIEGIKKGENEPSKDYKLTKTKEQVKNAFKYFIDENQDVLEKYIERLKDILAAAEKSEFFMTHEVIGSSLLFVHDHTSIASTWMIDFGKTSQLSDNRRLSHREPWVEGNREDGYLYGLDNLISIFEEILSDLKTKPRVQSSFDDDSESAVNTSSRSASLQTNWTFSSQSSSESVDFHAMDDPVNPVSDEHTRKPILRRQVAATNSCDDAPTSNGDATPGPGPPSNDGVMNRGDVIAQNSSVFEQGNVKNLTDSANSNIRTNGIAEDPLGAET